MLQLQDECSNKMLTRLIKKHKSKGIGILLLSLIVRFVYNFLQQSNENQIYLPKIIWWTPFLPGSDRVVECEQFNCLVTNNRNIIQEHNNVNAYLFYGSKIENNEFPLPRQSNDLWAIYHEESPKNYAPFLHENFQTLFNITATFSRFSDVPLTLQYLENIDSLAGDEYYKSVKEKNVWLKSIAPVLYIQSSCDTPIDRDHLVQELMKFIKVDSYGKCLNNKVLPKKLSHIDALDLYNEDYLEFISKYKFIIAFENAECDDYITEKLWRPLIVGSIPIYLGSPTIQDWLPNKNSAILAKEFADMKSLSEFIQKVNANDTMYNSFLEHKLHKKVGNQLLKQYYLNNLDDSVSKFECDVCKTVHKKIPRTSKHNIYNCIKPKSRSGNTWHQHWDVGECQAKALSNLITQGIPYTEEEFNDIWKECLRLKN